MVMVQFSPEVSPKRDTLQGDTLASCLLWSYHSVDSPFFLIKDLQETGTFLSCCSTVRGYPSADGIVTLHDQKII